MDQCANPKPGYLAEPYHVPGYSGHVPTMRYRNGGSYGRLTHDVLEDPCVPQAPIPVLTPPCPCPCRNSCGDSRPAAGKPSYRRGSQAEAPCPCEPDPDPRACHLNRSPYACPSKPEPCSDVYRRCEGMAPNYTGHVPGFTFHSNGRTWGCATFGTKKYMDECVYFNTFNQK